MKQNVKPENRKKVVLKESSGKSLRSRRKLEDTLIEFKIYQNNKEHIKNVKKIREEMKEKKNG